MALVYLPPHNGAIVQGEILQNLWEYSLPFANELSEDTQAPFTPRFHALVIVMSSDCDLEQDYERRFSNELNEARERDGRVDENDPGLLSHVIVCDMVSESDIRSRPSIHKGIWQRIRQNQDERYHCPVHPLSQATASGESDVVWAAMDFKKAWSVSTEGLYQGLHTGGITRIAVMPPVYLHDLMHRFYGFLSRVGTDALIKSNDQQ